MSGGAAQRLVSANSASRRKRAEPWQPIEPSSRERATRLTAPPLPWRSLSREWGRGRVRGRGRMRVFRAELETCSQRSGPFSCFHASAMFWQSRAEALDVPLQSRPPQRAESACGTHAFRRRHMSCSRTRPPVSPSFYRAACECPDKIPRAARGTPVTPPPQPKRSSSSRTAR
jgi:hypothetical protein